MRRTKKKLFLNKKIEVKTSTMHGFGVFAVKNIKKDELIEKCHVIVTKGGDKVLEDYYFDANGKDAIFFGYGCIYNHSDEPNTDYTINMKSKLATFKACKQIKKGEEICISYGEEWFKDRGRKAKKPKTV